ncbi:MAG: isopentenyl-diphosphate Delta-isomerase, partial [Rikenellaceae bacterium]|nr:isopentenyl-diphosphate Delta-isomerase [Rikenellaceae bacterium]
MVILVDRGDNQVGVSAKMEAHINGLLHRAVPVLIFHRHGEMLLQRRAMGKYHSPRLWANACCTHPLPGESLPQAASRRLQQEMGLVARLVYRKSFIYKEPVGNGLTEYEYDHIFTGISDMIPRCDPEEVMQYKYMKLDKIYEDIEN